ncbi:GerAB/ArcD/ProY family transporter [Scopulibacillus cellulosilyticus]|uniref:Endospore germination permease n=1 Tax=Scopulibacillus cellulosilyticus TaxID=2665665 RepID=A0ABW2PXG5_9BACL
MEKEKISAFQLFCIMMCFEVGTTVLFGLGADAKQDGWLSILLSMLSGLILMWVYIKLSNLYPYDTLTQMIPKIVGKIIGIPLVVIYISYFIYSAARACRDFSNLIKGTILTETPVIIIIGSFLILLIYCLRGGIEVFGRMGELIFPIYMLALILTWILMFGSQLIHLKQLTPVLAGGIRPVLNSAFPLIVTFPFGEQILIMMLLPALNNKKKIKKVGMLVILIGGILLTLNTIINLSILGPNLFGDVNYPLFTAARMVSIADFIQNIDAVIILMMIAGVFFKMGVWMYAAAAGTSQLFGLTNHHSILIPLGTLITSLSIVIASNAPEHLEIGFKYFAPYFLIPLEIVIPILLLVIACIRKKLSSRTHQVTG